MESVTLRVQNLRGRDTMGEVRLCGRPGDSHLDPSYEMADRQPV